MLSLFGKPIIIVYIHEYSFIYQSLVHIERCNFLSIMTCSVDGADRICIPAPVLMLFDDRQHHCSRPCGCSPVYSLHCALYRLTPSSSVSLGGIIVYFSLGITTLCASSVSQQCTLFLRDIELHISPNSNRNCSLLHVS